MTTQTKARKDIQINTPVGTAKWPKLTNPDYGSKDHPNPEGEYSVKMVWDETDPAFVKFRAKLEAVLERVVAESQEKFDALKKPQRDRLGSLKINQIFTPLYDENDEPTGQVEMKVKTKASGVTKSGPRAGKKWTRTPDLFDAFGRKLKVRPDIWGGSELIVGVSYDPEGYFVAGTGTCGVSVRLEAVQIITLRAGGERSAESYGFGKHDGGFSADDMKPEGDEDNGDDEFAGGGDEDHGGGDSSEPEGSTNF